MKLARFPQAGAAARLGVVVDQTIAEIGAVVQAARASELVLPAAA